MEDMNDSTREAFTLSWRPAGSRSLSEGWLRAGERSDVRRTPPQPPAPPHNLKLRPKRLKKS